MPPVVAPVLAGTHQFGGDHDPHQPVFAVHTPDVGIAVLAVGLILLQELMQRQHIVIPGLRRGLAEVFAEACLGDGKIGKGHGQLQLCRISLFVQVVQGVAWPVVIDGRVALKRAAVNEGAAGIRVEAKQRVGT